ncbi:MAG TPA: biotin/lipoyl-binding protein [Candidatus Cloacimonadota bacterium]|nr:biotin/lipoyl-binding protein [Candidatus Cloacimonadota bacterium]HPM02418.1 biotin/lipoyl-binding protein [Candidatus Cloacimonadota bacterium]
MKKYSMKINNENYQARIIEFTGNHAKVDVNGVEFVVELNTDNAATEPKIVQMEKPVPSVPKMRTDGKLSNDIKAPIPGVIVNILKKEGDTVHAGDVVVTLEAMKMETEIMADCDGIIQKINVKEKSPVQEGDVLVTIQAFADKPATPVQAPVQSKSQPVAQKPAPAPVKSPTQTSASTGSKTIVAPLPGIVLDIKVQVGQRVENNQAVVILEAMKMESEIYSNSAGTVKKILVNKGETVNDGQVLIELGD